MSNKKRYPEFLGYTTIQRLGEGSSANVYLVEDEEGKKYAIKQLCIQKEVLEKHESGEEISKPFLRFKEECKQLKHMEGHDNIVRIVETVIDKKSRGEQDPYFVMDYINGETLQEQILNKSISFERSLEAVLQIIKAVGHLHKQGIYHRDIHADNVVFSKMENKYVLIDFGLIKNFQKSLGITTKNNYIGYLTRIPIEYRNAKNDIVSEKEKYETFDIAGAGDLLYNLLTLHQSDKEKEMEHKLQQYNKQVDDNLYEICMKSLQINMDKRYMTIDAFGKELGQYLACLNKEVWEPETNEEYEYIRLGGKSYYLDIASDHKRGGEADLYRAYDEHKNEYVVKIYRQRKREELTERRKGILKKIREVAGNHIVNIYEADSIEEPKFFKNKLGVVMDNFHDGTLNDIYKNLDEKDVLSAIKQVAYGIEALHKQNIIHRDIKPGNILIKRFGEKIECYVTDFGLAKMKEGENHTTYGTIKGSPFYMAFEYVENKVYNEQTDIFSLGVTFYEMLTKGDTPYGLGSSGMLEYKEVNYSHELTKRYKCILEKMIAQDPAERYRYVGRFIGDIERIEELERNDHMKEIMSIIISRWSAGGDTIQSAASNITKGIDGGFIEKLNNFSVNIKEIEKKYQNFFKTIEQAASKFKLEVNPQIFSNYSSKEENEKQKMQEDLKKLLVNLNEESLEVVVKKYGYKQVGEFLNEVIKQVDKNVYNIETIETSKQNVLGLPMNPTLPEVKEIEKIKLEKVGPMGGNITSLRFEEDKLLIFVSYLRDKVYHQCLCYDLKSKVRNYLARTAVVLIGHSNKSFIGYDLSQRMFFRTNEKNEIRHFVDNIINYKGDFIYNGQRALEGIVGEEDRAIYLTESGLNYYSIDQNKVTYIWENAIKKYNDLDSLYWFNNGEFRIGMLPIDKTAGVEIFDDIGSLHEQIVFDDVPDLNEILRKPGNINYSKKENMVYIRGYDGMYSIDLNIWKATVEKDEQGISNQTRKETRAGKKVVSRFKQDICIEMQYFTETEYGRDMCNNEQYSIILPGEKKYMLDKEDFKDHELKNAVMSEDEKYIVLTFSKGIRGGEEVFIYTI